MRESPLLINFVAGARPNCRGGAGNGSADHGLPWVQPGLHPGGPGRSQWRKSHGHALCLVTQTTSTRGHENQGQNGAPGPAPAVPAPSSPPASGAAAVSSGGTGLPRRPPTPGDGQNPVISGPLHTLHQKPFSLGRVGTVWLLWLWPAFLLKSLLPDLRGAFKTGDFSIFPYFSLFF